MNLAENNRLADTTQAGANAVRGGAAQVNITPDKPTFLYGYPHVPRTSTGVLDPLLASALYLNDGRTALLWVACDLIWVPRHITIRARRRLADALGLDPNHIMVTSTHTHSGPVSLAMLSNASDPVVPPPDDAYLAQLEDTIVQAGRQAHDTARPVAIKFAVADGSLLGTNRHDPAGPSLPKIPVLWCQDAQTNQPIAVMAVCTMHPTVLHEDSTLISGDFPGQARQYLQQHAVSPACPFVYHMGAAGNQSPRHVVHANTIDETRRLGEVLARAIIDAAAKAEPMANLTLAAQHTQVDLPLRSLPTVDAAQHALRQATEHYEKLRRDGAPRTTVRTAECDVFGATETLTLAQAATEGKLADAAASCLPAEVQVFHIGEHIFVGWPGELYVEFALQVKQRYNSAWVITLAGGDLQGYLVTQEAVDQKTYESGNAIFESPTSGQRLVAATLELLEEHGE